MTELQLSLTRLIGKKELSFGLQVILKEWIGVKTVKGVDGFKQFKVCGNNKDFTISDCEEIIGHPPTLSDFHRMLATLGLNMFQEHHVMHLSKRNMECTCESERRIMYDSSKDLLSQSEETLKAIISLIQSYERN